MASIEGIGSPFLKQPSERSPKLRIYESLFVLNQGIDHVVALLRDMGKFPFADKDSMQCAIVEIEEVRCDMNADFTEELADRERFDEGHFWKQRRACEKKWRDPDDVYNRRRASRGRTQEARIAVSRHWQHSSALSRCPSGTALGSGAGTEEETPQKASEVTVGNHGTDSSEGTPRNGKTQ